MTQNPSLEAITSAVLALINAQTKAERREVVENQRHLLLIDAADQLFADWLKASQGDSDHIRLLQERRELLARCRKEGIDAAFADKAGSSSGKQDISPEIYKLIKQTIEAVERWHMDNSRQALDRAVAAWEVILRQPAITRYPEFAIKVRVELAETLRRCYLVSRQSEDLDRAIDFYEQALQATAQSSPERPSILNRLGGGLYTRFSLRGGTADLDRAIDFYEQALQATPQSSPERLGILYFLGRTLSDRFDLRRVATDLDQAIDLYEQALLVTSQNDPFRPERLNSLGDGLYRRFSLHGVAADLDRAIESYQQALLAAPQGKPSRVKSLNDQGIALSARFSLRGIAADLDRAIECWERALQTIAQSSPLHPGILSNLGGGLYTRFSLRGVGADLDRAVDFYEQALQATPDEPKSLTLNNLAAALRLRFSLHGGAANLDRAIECLQQALQATPQASPDRLKILNNLGATLVDRFNLRGRATDLNRAIENFEPLLQATPQRSPSRSKRLNNLGTALRLRFNLHGATTDLDQAIKSLQQALQATPQGSLERLRILNNLGGALRDRFNLHGATTDLDLAIESFEQALQVAPQGFSDRPSILNNHGSLLRDRFHLRRVAADLDRAIESLQQALQATSQGSPFRPSRLNNLGTALSDRFGLRGVAADLDRAIEYSKLALQVTPQNSPERPMHLNNLGLALLNRFGLREVAADLDQAIECWTLALQATAQNSPERPRFLNDLGLGLYIRFGFGGASADLNRAIESYQQALLATPQGSPFRPSRLNYLGNALFQRFGLRGAAADLNRAIESYEEGLELSTSDLFPAEHRSLAGDLADVYYEQIGDLAKARQAYEQAAAAAEVIHRRIRRRRAKERQAEGNALLYARLVYCCLATGDEASAFKYATAGKGRTFVDLLSSVQIDLANLSEKDKPLAEKVAQARQLRARLDFVSGQLLGERPSMGQNASPPQQLSKAQQAKLVEELKRLRQQDKKLWEEIQGQFPDYFATQSAEPFTLEEAQGLASQLDATLVSYYRHDKGWVAFVIRPDLPADTSFTVVKLSVTDEELMECADKFNSGLADRVLANLRWSEKMANALITPLLAHLPSPTAAIPARRRAAEPSVVLRQAQEPGRLVLAPFSGLHLLPLATLPRTPIPWRESGLPQVRYLSDEYAVTVTPSLAMLKRVMERRQRGEKRETLCAIAYPGSQGSKHYLKHVVPEAKAIAPLFTQSTTRLDSAATRQAAIKDVKGRDVAHYSCHGLFDRQEVEQSSLLLSGGMLTLRDIFNSVRLPNASLVTLSACNTGMALPRQGDELAGMVQGFVYAGTPTVIASLWAVNDAATRYLFERFYEHYTTGIAAVEALRTAQQELRQHSYAHPYYWAAFQAIGAAYDSLPITSRAIRPAQQVILPPKQSKTKGAYPMSIPTEQAILNKAQRILQNLKDFASGIAQELTAEERTIFLATLETLSTQPKTISQERRLQLASDIISAFEAIPLLRENFVGDVDPETEKNKRELTLQAAIDAAKPLPGMGQEPQQVHNIYQHPLKNICQLLRDAEKEAPFDPSGGATRATALKAS